LREELSRVLAEDYIRTARAKGAPVWRHAFKEGFLIPVTEIMSAKIPFLLGGAVIVEQVFNWPGMGRMAWQAAQDRDFPVIMGIALAAAARAMPMITGKSRSCAACHAMRPMPGQLNTCSTITAPPSRNGILALMISVTGMRKPSLNAWRHTGAPLARAVRM